MLEQDFNSLVTRSLNNQGGFGFKIPDERSTITGFHSKNPYDVFGIFNNRFVCWESKYLTSPKAFNFTKLEDHQIDNLIKCFELCPNSYCVFAVGVNFGRSDVRVYVWKNEDLYTIKKRKTNKQNILKKEFEQRKNYIRVKKGEVNLEEVFNLPLDKFIL